MKTVRYFISAVTFAVLAVAPLPAQEPSKFLYGVASWYGSELEGKPTASGEIFSAERLTAAHKTLPFGTRVEVENLGNGKKVEVLINDRGPFADNRIIDLSRSAAEILEFISEGKTFVKVTVLEVGDPVTKPLGQPAPATLGQDIPQNFQSDITPAAPQAEEDVDEEAFMNDQTLPAENAEPPLRTQSISNEDLFGSDIPALVGFTNFSSNSSVPTAEDPLNPQNDPDLSALSNIAFPDEFDLEPENTYEVDPFADLADPFNTAPVVPQNNIQYNTITPEAGNMNIDGISQNVGINQPYAPIAMPSNNTGGFPPSSSADPVKMRTNVVTITNVVNQVMDTRQPITGKWRTNPPSPNEAQSYYVIQVGAFSKSDNALKVYNTLKKNADPALANVYTSDVKAPIKGREKSVMRVRVGFFLDQDEALTKSDEINALLGKDGIKSSVIKVDYK